MKFYNINNRSEKVTLREAVVKSLAKDKGLYMPEHIPNLPAAFWKDIHSRHLQDIAREVTRPYFGGEIEEPILRDIVEDALNFDIPLTLVHDNIYSLELFHGPTLAFKDVGARCMARILAYLMRNGNKEVHVLVATSGDTGSAVANGFLNVQGIQVTILYPSGKVSLLQEKQFTTLGGNITALEVDGTFDDCQDMVKQAFADAELNRQLLLTSANSINIARLIPQAIYYFYAYAQLKKIPGELVFSIPSGNFGNLTAGLIAKKMGLPVRRFLAATNINEVVPKYLKSGIFSPQPSLSTISNAMDVGNPSNFVRMMELYGGAYDGVIKDVQGYAFTDKATRQTMKDVYQDAGYILDPHGAVAYAALHRCLSENANGQTGVFLETAHPAKFIDTVRETLNTEIHIPARLRQFADRPKSSVRLSNHFTALKEFLMER